MPCVAHVIYAYMTLHEKKKNNNNNNNKTKLLLFNPLKQNRLTNLTLVVTKCLIKINTMLLMETFNN